MLNSCIRLFKFTNMIKIFLVKLTSISLIIFLVLNQINQIESDTWEYKLVHDVLDGYDPSIRPSVHHNATLNVTFGLALAQLIDVVRIYLFSFKIILKVNIIIFLG